MKRKSTKTVTDDDKKSFPTDREANGQAYHIPVLLQEAIDGLAINPNGVYVDCTFGGGGHSAAILEKLNANGKLIAFDQDEDVVQNLPEDKRIVFIQQNFRHIQRFLRLHGINKVDGILADLGVSSHQFDDARRGFSTRFNAELDMRMDKQQLTTAYNIVQTYSEARLHKLFEQYGEVTNSKTLAKTIAGIREATSLKTVEAFKSALHEVVKGNPKKYFAQVFQALRIEVNEEMKVLREMLEQSVSILSPGGRIAIITFHSIEDRIVKNFFRDGGFEEIDDNPFVNTERKKVFKLVTKKPIVANEKELNVNPRARSAKLRIAERLG